MLISQIYFNKRRGEFGEQLLRSVRRRAACSLNLRGLCPPCETVGKAWKCQLERLTQFADRLAIGVEGLSNGAYGKSARDDHHPHLSQGSMPSETGSGAG